MSKEENQGQAPIRRRKLFVDVKLQGALLAHTTMYWSYCLLSVGVIAVAWIVLVKKPMTSNDLFDHLLQNFGPALIGAFLLLPLVLLDCLRLSNRFAGPMVRIQRAMKQLANGEQPNKINLRDGDYWSDFVNDLNRVIDQRAAATTTLKAERPAVTPGAPVAAVAPAPSAAPLEQGSFKASNIYSDAML